MARKDVDFSGSASEGSLAAPHVHEVASCTCIRTRALMSKVHEHTIPNDFGPIADVYDELVSWAPYGKWVKHLERRLRRHGLNKEHVVLDAACGTGLSTLPWQNLGYRVVGVDHCEETLQQAQKKIAHKDMDVSFLRRNLLDLRFPPSFGAAVCMHSGLDYILEEDDLRRAFRSLRTALFEGALLAFDKCLDEPDFYKQDCTSRRELSCGEAVFHYRWDRGRRLFEQRCVVTRKLGGKVLSRTEVVYLMRATPLAELVKMVEGEGFRVLEPPRQFKVSDPGMGIFRAV